MKLGIRGLFYFFLYLLLTHPTKAAAQFASSAPAVGSFDNFLVGFLENFLSWIFTGIGIFSLLGLPIAALLYISSGGADDRLAIARRIFVYSFFGLFIAIAGYFLVGYVQSVLNL